MSGDEITLSLLKERSRIPDRGVCEEEGCSVTLDRMSDRVVFHPDEDDSVSHQRADCAIFFPSEDDSGTLYRHSETNNQVVPEYLAIVELKNTIEKPSQIENQIEGALDFAVELLEGCKNPPWNLKCLCVVAKNRVNVYRKPVDQIRIRKHINGKTFIFNPLIVDSEESVRDIFAREMGKDATVEL